MARDFPDAIALAVPLRTTWEEQWILTDDDGEPVDLTGYEFRMQVRAKEDAAGHAAGDLLLDPARREVSERALRPMNETPIVAAELGPDAGMIGAAAMARIEADEQARR